MREEDPEAQKNMQANYKRKMEKIMKTVKKQGEIIDQNLYQLQLPLITSTLGQRFAAFPCSLRARGTTV